MILIMGCSEKKSVNRAAAVDEDVHAEYDTTAIDSFSPGAISASVEARIRQSAIRVSNSLSSVRKKEEDTRNKASEIARAKADANKSTSATANSSGTTSEKP